jgi:glutamine amidotransferase
MIAIIDYGLGNLGSIQNMIKKIGENSKIITHPEELSEAKKIILSGVGSFDTGMNNLIKRGWIEVLNKLVLNDSIPILGICLGMQLMTQSSEEGFQNGLGWISANTEKFNFDTNIYKIPHMGWNDVMFDKDSKLFNSQDFNQKFYFVHSYYIKKIDNCDVTFKTVYGEEFVSGFEYKNIAGVQFHPEKSHKYGMKLLENFINNF